MALSALELKNIIRGRNNANSDDIRVIRSWTEYANKKETEKGEDRPLKHLMFEMEVKEPDGMVTRVFKALKFVRVIRLPKSAKQSESFMNMHAQVLSGVYEKGANLITIIANMIDPIPLGLLFLYGVQGVATDEESAKEIADSDFLALRGTLQGTYRVLEARETNAKEVEWLRQKMFAMNCMTVIRGIPKANEGGVDAGNKGFGGQNLNPNSQDTLEEFISGMADREYVLQVLSTPVKFDVLTTWQRKTQQEMTKWHAQRQGSKAISFNLSIPIMYSSNLSNSQGWSHSYSDATSAGRSVGESFGQSFGISQGNAINHSEGTTVGKTVGTTITDSVSQSHSISQGSSYSLSQGQNVSESVGQNQNMSQSIGASQGVSQNMNESLGHNFGISHNTGQNISNSVSHSEGGSYGISSSESINSSHSIGTSQNVSLGQSSNISQSVNSSISDSVSSSRGVSTSSGFSSSKSEGFSSGSSFGSSVSNSSGSSQSQGTSSSTSGGTSKGGGVGVLGLQGNTSEQSGWSSGGSSSNSVSNSVGYSQNNGYNVGKSNSLTQGASFSNGQTATNGVSHGISQGVGFSESKGQSFSQGYGTSEGFSEGVSVGKGQSWGQSWSDGQSSSVGASVSDGYSEGVSQSASQGWGQNSSQSQSLANSVGISEGKSVGASLGQSYGQTAGESWGISQGRSVGQSESESVSKSVTDGTSESYGTSQGVSKGTSQGTSESRSLGQSLGTSGGFAQGFGSSMGIGPSIGYSKSFSWLDQQVEDILELLTFQNERLKLSLRGNGAFFTDVYLALPDSDALSQATALAKSTWQNQDAKISPVQVLDLAPEEQAHMLLHFSAFSADVSKEGIPGRAESYRYSTLLLPHEFAALTHLPRISEGGVFADINDIPKFAVPSMKKGEIYMGKILSAERFTMTNGYVTPYDYRIDSDELMHGIFTGASRSGKTVAATRFIAELSRVRRKTTGKRFRIVCLDPKQDWRILARFVEPERFKFYSLGNTQFRPINLNLCKIPKNVWPQQWIDGLIDIYCRAYGLLERGKQILGETLYALYEEAGVFDACDHANWRELVPERSSSVSFVKVYKKMDEIRKMLDDPRSGRKAGNDTRDAYARILDRLQVFDRQYSIEVQLFGQETGMGVDDLIGQDDVVVLESYGLSDSSFKNFVFGAITSGFFKYAQANEGGFLAEDQYETVLVIEEANEVLTGNDTAGGGGGGGPTLSGQSDFEKILDQAAGLGMYIFPITQKIADMPSSVVANCGLIFAGRLKRPDDVNVVIRSIAREERFEDRDLVKWIPRAPTGWLICQSSRVFEFKDMEPVLVQIAKLDASTPSNAELEALLTEKQALKVLNGG